MNLVPTKIAGDNPAGLCPRLKSVRWRVHVCGPKIVSGLTLYLHHSGQFRLHYLERPTIYWTLNGASQTFPIPPGRFPPFRSLP